MPCPSPDALMVTCSTIFCARRVQSQLALASTTSSRRMVSISVAAAAHLYTRELPVHTILAHDNVSQMLTTACLVPPQPAAAAGKHCCICMVQYVLSSALLLLRLSVRAHCYKAFRELCWHCCCTVNLTEGLEPDRFCCSMPGAFCRCSCCGCKRQFQS